MSEQMKKSIREFFEKNVDRPLSVQELEEELNVDHAVDFKNRVITLNELEETGELVRTRKNRFGIPEKMNLIRGRIQMHKKGFAFLIPDDSEQTDVYIHHSDLKSAMNNDKVLVRLEKNDGGDQRPEGRVIRILERSVHQVVGTFEDNHSFGFVIADDKRIPNDIFIPKGMSAGAVTGHKVIAEITKYPEAQKSAEGAVTKIIGHKNDPGIDIISIIYKNGIKTDFPEEVLEQAANAPEVISEEEMEGRRDLRDRSEERRVGR